MLTAKEGDDISPCSSEPLTATVYAATAPQSTLLASYTSDHLQRGKERGKQNYKNVEMTSLKPPSKPATEPGLESRSPESETSALSVKHLKNVLSDSFNSKVRRPGDVLKITR